MEHKMNMAKRQLSQAETLEILEKGHHGTLAVNGDDGYPYAVPINYVVLNGTIYLHSAQYGYKIDCLKKNAKCCFSTIISAKILPSKITAAYESVVATGNISFVEDTDEKQKALEKFVTHLCTGYEEVGFKMIKGVFHKTAVLRLDAVEMTGKAYRENN